MADIVYIQTSNPNGAKVLNALRKIQEGIGELNQLDGLRANSIGSSQAVMATNFGTADNTQAQILSDRLSSVTSWYAGEIPGWMTTPADARSVLRDLLDAVTNAP